MSLYNKYFYNEIVKKYVIGFGSLFTNIYILRKDSNGNELNRELVPLTYAPKEKFVQRIEQDPELETKVALKLPRMGFEITSFSYAPERKLSSKRKLSQPSGENKEYFYNPVPYDFDFTLYIATKPQEEGLQIIEQILPFFTPDYTLTMKLTTFESYLQDIPISLQSVFPDDSYEGRFEEKREIIWTLGFTLHGYLLGPKRSAKRILETKINLYTNQAASELIVTPLEEFDNIYPNYSINTIEGLSGESSAVVFSDYVDVKFSVELKLDADTNFNINTNKLLSNYSYSGFLRKGLSSNVIYDITLSENNTTDININIDSSLSNSLEPGIYVYVISFEDNNSNDDFMLTGLVIRK